MKKEMYFSTSKNSHTRLLFLPHDKIHVASINQCTDLVIAKLETNDLKIINERTR